MTAQQSFLLTIFPKGMRYMQDTNTTLDTQTPIPAEETAAVETAKPAEVYPDMNRWLSAFTDCDQ